MKKKAVIVSGYFNPIHKGHLEYFNNAKAMADELFVIVNNDHQRALKGSKEFQGEEERMIIVSNIKAVDQAILSVDEDRTVCATLEKIANEYGKTMIWPLPTAVIKTTTPYQNAQSVKKWASPSLTG